MDAAIKEYSMKIGTKNIPYYIINDRRGMFFENMSEMMEANLPAIHQRFKILTKRVRLDGKRFYLEENKHYDYVTNLQLGVTDLKSVTIFKPKPFIYFEGVTIFLGFMRGEVRDEIYLVWNERFHEELRENQKSLYRPKTIYELPVFPGMLYSRNYTICSSKFETTVCDIFYDFGIDIRRMDYYYISKLKQKSQKLLRKNGLSGIDFDFYVTTKPYTIVDVQGIKNKKTYQIKEDICKIEGWSLFIIRKDEDRNIPKLRSRIKKYFVGG